jgi:membrane protein
MSVSRGRRFFSFLSRLFFKAADDGIALRSSALAFSTLLSIVPLLAVISTFIAQGFRETDGRIVDLLVELLPYREETIESAISSFVDQAQGLSELGLLGFLLASMSAFVGLEAALNRIWRIEGRRQLFPRLVSFSMLLFWGPLLIGASYSLLLWVRQHPRLAAVTRESFLLGLLPVVVTFLGLTMLFWLVPNRRVVLRHAAIGSAVSTFGLELLKIGFAKYVEHFTEATRVVYGGFVFAILFVVSLQLAWWILLMGCEVAACIGLPAEAERRPTAGFRPDPWTAVLVLRLLGERFGTLEPGLADVEAASRFGLDGRRLRALLRPLVERGVVEPPATPWQPYRLAVHPARLRLDHLFEPYEPGIIDPAVAAELPPELVALASRSRDAWGAALGNRTLADLLPKNAPARDLNETLPGTEPGDLELPL